MLFTRIEPLEVVLQPETAMDIRYEALGFTEAALWAMSAADAEYELSDRRRGRIDPEHAYGFRAINRCTRTGSPTMDGPIFPTRIEALADGHLNGTPGYVFERVERVLTSAQSLAASVRRAA